MFLLGILLAGCAVVPVGNTGSGIIGPIVIGQVANGTIVGGNAAIWHTYILTVLAGTNSITIRMDANEDLDMAAKYGSEIQSYDPVTGDYDFIDVSLAQSAEFIIVNPQVGDWYIDVFNALGAGTSGNYTLLVTAQ